MNLFSKLRDDWMQSETRTQPAAEYDLAVIIPVYNVEQYLEACLDSILSQTIAERIQLIVINDGSTDASGAIARKFADLHPSIIYLEKENEGQGVARNLGMTMASAPYVIFLDSDDRMPPDACGALLNEIVKTNADLVLGRPMWKRDDGSEDPFGYLDHWYTAENYGRNVRRMPELALTHPIPVAKIYSLDFLRAHQLQFPPITGEDAAFAMAVVDRARDIRIISHIVYWRTERADPANLSVMQTFTLKTSMDRIRLIQLFLECYDRSALPASVLRLIYSKVGLILSMIGKIADADDRAEAYRALGECLYRWAKPGEREMYIDPLLAGHGYAGGLYELISGRKGGTGDERPAGPLESVGVIVLCDPTKHTADDLTHVLDQIAAQSLRVADVTVVGAEPSLAAGPAPEGLEVRIASGAGNLSGMINDGIKSSQAEWIRFVQCGSQVPEDQFAAMVSSARIHACDGVYVMPPEHQKQKLAPWGDLSREVFLGSACGTACRTSLMVRRQVFLELGGLDADFEEFGMEKFLIGFFRRHGMCGVLDAALGAPSAPAARVSLACAGRELAALREEWSACLDGFAQRFSAAVDFSLLRRMTTAAVAQGDPHYITSVLHLLESTKPSLLVPYVGWLESTHGEVYESLATAWVATTPPRLKSPKPAQQPPPPPRENPPPPPPAPPQDPPHRLPRLF